MAMRCGPVVSIQRKTAEDAVGGHLSWGVLIEPDRVLIPGPMDWLHDPAVPIEVLVVSVQRGGRSVVERLGVQRADVQGVQGSPAHTFAVLRLAHPSRHPPVAGTPFDSGSLGAALAAGSDAWTAFERLGVVPAGVRDYPVADVLGPVVHWEQIKRRDLVRMQLAASFDDAAIRWCCLFRICANCHECAGPWW